jgi:hypothetical protein
MDDDYVTRAYADWFRECHRVHGVLTQPSSASSGVETHNGRDYVVLRNCNGILKVYRVRLDGSLKGLLRWPKAFEES